MPLPSFFQRKPAEKPTPKTRPKPQPAPAGDGGPVEAARAQARRRLIGAIVLLAIGIIGFPLLFETQPRPIATDIPIELPKGAGTSHPASAPVVAARAPQPVEPAAAPGPVAPPAAESAVAVAPARAPDAPPPPAKPTPPARTEPVKAAAAPVAPPEPAKPAAPKPTPRAEDGARALALLQGESDAASQSHADRFVVQVGAYTDAAALRDARQRVEKLGYKTYTQVVTTDAGSRTRVRVGPFASHQQAAEVSARLKSAGLPVAILAL